MWWRDKWNKIYAYPLSDWTYVIKYQVYDNCIVVCTTQNIPKIFDDVFCLSNGLFTLPDPDSN